ncbi:MAG: dihydroorotate dehydrogenase [Rhodobacteraceae bacterium]|nr:dihydroorotate dehydrogenase [Paracoccaceae bacterium]
MFLAAGRAARPDPSADLMARIVADALAEMPAPRPLSRPAPAAPPRRGVRARIAALTGGWGNLGGLVAATLVGVWIGFAAPGPLAALSAGVLGEVLGTAQTSAESVDLVNLLPDFDDFLTEG